MNQSDVQYATEKLAQLKSEYMVHVLVDWGDDSGTWQAGNWAKEELDKLDNSIACFANRIGGQEKFKEYIGGVTVKKADIGSHGGEALSHRISLSTKGTFSAWTVAHEFAHAWDANHGWKLSRMLEKYTGGNTSPVLSLLKRLAKLSDSGFLSDEDKPGRRGRQPGCNRAGYFYGDKPSGSNWKFNRIEDFAESVAMYIGWEKGNDLSNWAKARINRYLLDDGVEDKNFGADNWAYYKKYFYPQDGDYSKTKRWQFVDDLVNGRMRVE
jgi:hypothetical protein